MSPATWEEMADPADEFLQASCPCRRAHMACRVWAACVEPEPHPAKGRQADSQAGKQASIQAGRQAARQASWLGWLDC